jgi:hypothetical protein
MRAEDDGGPWSLVALLSGVLVFVAVQVSAPFDGTLALLKGDVSDDTARAFSAADYYALSATYPIAGVLTLAASVLILRTGILWPPLARLGMLVTAGGLIAGAAPLERDAEGVLTYAGYVTLLAFFVWTVGVSVALLHMNSPPTGSRTLRDREPHR